MNIKKAICTQCNKEFSRGARYFAGLKFRKAKPFCSKECGYASKVKDYTGAVFGKITVIERSRVEKKQNGTYIAYWLCRCKCGKETYLPTGNFYKDRIKSCGCLKNVDRHGMSKLNNKHPIYDAWSTMKQRCLNPKNSNYYNYGGRGISVCDRWLESFENFYADMGGKPTPKHSIDRIDVNGNYEPNNCKWATWDEQANNKRSNVMLELKGVLKNQKQWALEFGISEDRLWRRRVDKQMSIEQIANEFNYIVK